MDFERTDDFMNDLTVTVVWQKDADTTVTVSAFYDSPNQDITPGYAITATDFSITFVTEELDGLEITDALTVDGKSFVVRGLASVGDGVFSRATLKKA